MPKIVKSQRHTGKMQIHEILEIALPQCDLRDENEKKNSEQGLN
jgi:hypothetical protein